MLLGNACLNAWKDGHDWMIVDVHFSLMAEGGMEGRGWSYEWLTKGICVGMEFSDNVERASNAIFSSHRPTHNSPCNEIHSIHRVISPSFPLRCCSMSGVQFVLRQLVPTITAFVPATRRTALIRKLIAVFLRMAGQVSLAGKCFGACGAGPTKATIGAGYRARGGRREIAAKDRCDAGKLSSKGGIICGGVTVAAMVRPSGGVMCGMVLAARSCSNVGRKCAVG